MISTKTYKVSETMMPIMIAAEDLIGLGSV